MADNQTIAKGSVTISANADPMIAGLNKSEAKVSGWSKNLNSRLLTVDAGFHRLDAIMAGFGAGLIGGGLVEVAKSLTIEIMNWVKGTEEFEKKLDDSNKKMEQMRRWIDEQKNDLPDKLIEMSPGAQQEFIENQIKAIEKVKEELKKRLGGLSQEAQEAMFDVSKFKNLSPEDQKKVSDAIAGQRPSPIDRKAAEEEMRRLDEDMKFYQKKLEEIRNPKKPFVPGPLPPLGAAIDAIVIAVDQVNSMQSPPWLRAVLDGTVAIAEEVKKVPDGVNKINDAFKKLNDEISRVGLNDFGNQFKDFAEAGASVNQMFEFVRKQEELRRLKEKDQAEKEYKPQRFGILETALQAFEIVKDQVANMEPAKSGPMFAEALEKGSAQAYSLDVANRYGFDTTDAAQTQRDILAEQKATLKAIERMNQGIDQINSNLEATV